MDASDRFGLSAALATPFTADLGVDLPLLSRHARRCLEQGCHSVTLLGTTGENASVGRQLRSDMLNALRADGITGSALVVGISACSFDDAAEQIAEAYRSGADYVLIPPPFYFKAVDAEGIYNWYTALFRLLGDELPKVLLYNIPSQTAVPMPISLISRLTHHCAQVVGVKDSSGDWHYTQSLLAAHGDRIILIGDERHLAPAIALGASGSICGMANLHPARLRAIVDTAVADPLINELVPAAIQHPFVPALKHLLADHHKEAGWLHLRPPLHPLTAADARSLITTHHTLLDRIPMPA